MREIINKYTSYIYDNNKQIKLGSFENENEAALMYNEAAKKYFGDFARTNIIKQ